MVRRSRLIICFMSIIFIGILCNLFLIAYVNPALSVASSQSKWTVTVSTTRGSIYDRHMHPLVNAETEYKAVCSPDVDLLTTLKQYTTDSHFQSITNAMIDGVPIAVPLIRSIADQDDVLCFATRKRYGDRLLAPHIVGYCQDGVGVSGIELSCESTLSHYNGSTTVTYETSGGKQYLNGVKPLISDTTQRSNGGVSLTLSAALQKVVEDTAAPILTKGAVVVLDPYNGDMVACASFPSYQPNSLSVSLQDDDGALINRALSLYDCGSVFKVITAAAALENGISHSREYVCEGSIDVGGTVFHCHNRAGHGVLDMTQACAYSCNTYFIQLARDVGADALCTLANAFGFNRKITLIDGLTTAAPLFPTRIDLERPAALANLSFGQGYLMTTPLHIAQIIATIVNDGAMPSVNVLQGYVDENGSITKNDKQPSYTIITENTAKTLRHMMSEAVLSGTGKNAMPALCTAAGKTGTAETGQISDNGAVVQSWFAGYFPAEDPQYVVVVLAEDSNATNEQAPSIFCEISNNLYKVSKSRE